MSLENSDWQNLIGKLCFSVAQYPFTRFKMYNLNWGKQTKNFLQFLGNTRRNFEMEGMKIPKVLFWLIKGQLPSLSNSKTFVLAKKCPCKLKIIELVSTIA